MSTVIGAIIRLSSGLKHPQTSRIVQAAISAAPSCMANRYWSESSSKPHSSSAAPGNNIGKTAAASVIAPITNAARSQKIARFFFISATSIFTSVAEAGRK